MKIQMASRQPHHAVQLTITGLEAHKANIIMRVRLSFSIEQNYNKLQNMFFEYIFYLSNEPKCAILEPDVCASCIHAISRSVKHRHTRTDDGVLRALGSSRCDEDDGHDHHQHDVDRRWCVRQNQLSIPTVTKPTDFAVQIGGTG